MDNLASKTASLGGLGERREQTQIALSALTHPPI